MVSSDGLGGIRDRLEVYTFKATPFRNCEFFLEKTTQFFRKVLPEFSSEWLYPGL